MSQESSLPSFQELATILQKIQPNCHVSEVHGLVCAYACAEANEDMDLWAHVFPGVKKNRKGEEAVHTLFEATYHQLSEFSFEFALLLPEDDSDINGRAESLSIWCQGFLTGLGQMDVSVQNVQNIELKEAFEDIIEIAQITFGDITPTEDDETAYFELIEYVRLSVILIFHELRNETSEGMSENDILH